MIEYTVAAVSGGTMAVSEFLNKMAKQGWRLITVSSGMLFLERESK